MIRLARQADLASIAHIYACARSFMAQSGNPGQWGDAYPPEALTQADIRAERLYAVTQGDRVVGAFVFLIGAEPFYERIYGGQWLSDAPYGTIHRIAASGAGLGVFGQCMEFCKAQCPHLRIDTHRDNRVMRHLIPKHGFSYRGVIHVRDNSPRLAYEYLC